MRRFEVWLVMKNPDYGRVVENLGLCTIVTPDELNNARLSTLQYQIDGDKNKCSHVL